MSLGTINGTCLAGATINGVPESWARLSRDAERPDGLVSMSRLAIRAHAVHRERDTVSAAGALGIGARAIRVEEKDAVVARAELAVRAVLAVVERSDTVTAGGVFPILAWAVGAERPDSLFGHGEPPFAQRVTRLRVITVLPERRIVAVAPQRRDLAVAPEPRRIIVAPDLREAA